MAVVLGQDALTYGELALLSDRLAAGLREAGCSPGDRVALLVPKSPIALASILAVLKAGCVYVPLDPESPAARLGRIVDSAEPTLLLATPERASLLDQLAERIELPRLWSVSGPVAGERVASERDRDGWDVEAAPPAAGIRADDPAYLLFTSGSTGEPKGVVITHRNVVAFTEWFLRAYPSRPGERVSGHPALHFDLSTLDLYTALAAGAELRMVPAQLGFDARRLAAWIEESAINRWVSVPSVLAFMTKFGLPREGGMPDLERILWCGEALPTPVLALWMRRLPHVSFTNLYGPTEATVASTYFDVPEVPDDDDPPVPIGRACDGEEVLVLDEDLRQVAVGEVGELYLGGVGLSPGYWRDREKTASAFLPDPRGGKSQRIYRTGDLGRVDQHGLAHFLGRADSQVKSRGYRIELGEVENALATVPGIAECAVVGLEVGGLEGTAICAAYVGEDGAEAKPRAGLAALVPGYMLPRGWMELEELPRNQNGKVDRRRLREQFERRAARRKERA